MHEAYADARSIVKGELERDDPGEERRQALPEEAMRTADKQAAFAPENSATNDRAFRAVNGAGTKYAIIAAVTALVLVCGL
ncbi:hypothetical protein [Microbacterium sp.]|uniref:hypothetical protein n=1 Tax=Microbacterium sp. TaxID=51671 RepID=UPI0035B356F5